MHTHSQIQPYIILSSPTYIHTPIYTQAPYLHAHTRLFTPVQPDQNYNPSFALSLYSAHFVLMNLLTPTKISLPFCFVLYFFSSALSVARRLRVLKTFSFFLSVKLIHLLLGPLPLFIVCFPKLELYISLHIKVKSRRAACVNFHEFYRTQLILSNLRRCIT